MPTLCWECVSETYGQLAFLRKPKQANITFIPQFGLQLFGIFKKSGISWMCVREDLTCLPAAALSSLTSGLSPEDKSFEPRD